MATPIPNTYDINPFTCGFTGIVGYLPDGTAVTAPGSGLTDPQQAANWQRAIDGLNGHDGRIKNLEKLKPIIQQIQNGGGGGGGNGSDTHWGICQSNWNKITALPSAGGKARVTVQECDDSLGTNPTGVNVVLYLPINAKGDPNLITGDVVSFVYTKNGTPVCTSSYMDDPVGTVKEFTGAKAQIRPGWQDMDGSQTHSLATAIDMRDKFSRSTTTDGSIGTAGGSDTHDHGAVTGSAATGITVDDHVDHAHYVDVTGTAVGTGGGDTGINAALTGGVVNTDGTSAYPGVLGHTVNDPTHYHSISSDNNIPAFYYLRKIERVDNSA